MQRNLSIISNDRVGEAADNYSEKLQTKWRSRLFTNKPHRFSKKLYISKAT